MTNSLGIFTEISYRKSFRNKSKTVGDLSEFYKRDSISVVDDPMTSSPVLVHKEKTANRQMSWPKLLWHNLKKM